MNLDGYLLRIGYVGSRAPTLATLHALVRAHVQTIPFENIDVLLGRPIDLSLEALERKLVDDRRGGYCFEHNTLLLEVLLALGFNARPLSARVRYQRPRDYTPARTHLLVRVDPTSAPPFGGAARSGAAGPCDPTSAPPFGGAARSGAAGPCDPTSAPPFGGAARSGAAGPCDPTSAPPFGGAARSGAAGPCDPTSAPPFGGAARSGAAGPCDLEESWLADVGVGAMSPTAALRLAEHGEQATPHEPRRLLRENDRIYHQVRFGDDWHDVAELTLEEMPPIDRIVASWYTSAHPQSHFKNRLLVARATPTGRVTLLNDELSIRGMDGRADKVHVESSTHLLELLAEHFGLVLPAGTHVPYRFA